MAKLLKHIRNIRKDSRWGHDVDLYIAGDGQHFVRRFLPMNRGGSNFWVRSDHNGKHPSWPNWHSLTASVEVIIVDDFTSAEAQLAETASDFLRKKASFAQLRDAVAAYQP